MLSYGGCTKKSKVTKIYYRLPQPQNWQHISIKARRACPSLPPCRSPNPPWQTPHPFLIGSFYLGDSLRGERTPTAEKFFRLSDTRAGRTSWCCCQFLLTLQEVATVGYPVPDRHPWISFSWIIKLIASFVFGEVVLWSAAVPPPLTPAHPNTAAPYRFSTSMRFSFGAAASPHYLRSPSIKSTLSAMIRGLTK